jgi:hypothetical protein
VGRPRFSLVLSRNFSHFRRKRLSQSGIHPGKSIKLKMNVYMCSGNKHNNYLEIHTTKT